MGNSEGLCAVHGKDDGLNYLISATSLFSNNTAI